MTLASAAGSASMSAVPIARSNGERWPFSLAADALHWRFRAAARLISRLVQCPKPLRLQAVVFDLDGLMFNTEMLYQQVGGELLRRRGKLFEADLLDQIMGRRTHVALQMMIDWHGLNDTVETLTAESAQIFSVIFDTQLAQMPGLSELLDALEKAGLRKAIATSSVRAFTERVLGQFDMARRFEFILTAEDVSEGKPRSGDLSNGCGAA